MTLLRIKEAFEEGPCLLDEPGHEFAEACFAAEVFRHEVSNQGKCLLSKTVEDNTRQPRGRNGICTILLMSDIGLKETLLRKGSRAAVSRARHGVSSHPTSAFQ